MSRSAALSQSNSLRYWPGLARAVCLALLLVPVGLFAAGVPLRARQLSTVVSAAEPAIFPGLPPHLAATYTSRLEPAEAEALQALGLSLRFYTVYMLAFEIGLAAICAGVGLFIFWRRSEGWLTLWVSLLLVLLGTTAVSPEVHTLATVWLDGELFQYRVGLLGMVTFLHILYLAPDGRFVPRWTLRLAAGYTGGTLALHLYLAANPWVWNAMALLLSFIVTVVVWWILSGVGIGSQVYRYQHVSGAVERQQIKWVAVGLAAVTLGILLNGALVYVVSQAGGLARVLLYLLRTPLLFVCLLGLPISLAFSILRYRLWDIDLIIRRTLIYASLTAALVVVYFSSIVLLQSLAGTLTGESRSPLVTILSTLAIFALFGPLRRRVQNLIDRRFFRRKYDAARTLAEFGTRLRDEVNLDRLSVQLVDAAQDTLQPEHVSLWLRAETTLGPQPAETQT